MQAYLKNQFEFLGLPAPVCRRAKLFWRRLALGDQPWLLELAQIEPWLLDFGSTRRYQEAGNMTANHNVVSLGIFSSFNQLINKRIFLC